MSEEQNATENVANLENLSPRELRELVVKLQQVISQKDSELADTYRGMAERQRIENLKIELDEWQKLAREANADLEQLREDFADVAEAGER